MKCRLCKEELVSQDYGDVCDRCSCPDCGTPLETDNERGMGICTECEDQPKEEG